MCYLILIILLLIAIFKAIINKLVASALVMYIKEKEYSMPNKGEIAYYTRKAIKSMLKIN